VKKRIITTRRILVILLLITGTWLAFTLLPREFILRIGQEIIEQRLVVLLLVLFLMIMLSLLWAAGQGLDSAVFLLINRLGERPRWLDRLMLALTQLGTGFVGFGLAGAAYLLDLRLLAYQVLLGMLSLWLTVEIVKAFTERSRPFRRHEQARILGFRALGLSFPSGHTAQSFFLAAVLVYYFSLGWIGSIVFYLLAALVGVTRMYVGAHYPRDVLAGGILGLAWGILTSLLAAPG
jgi:membrane-associated phospholipid phosphatase